MTEEQLQEKSNSLEVIRREIEEAYQCFYKREHGINKYKEVIVRDLSDFVHGKVCNGGCHAFSTFYVWCPEKELYGVSYGTSARAPFCSGCGSFADCNCKCKYVTEARLEKIIASYDGEDKIEVEIFSTEEEK